MRCIIWAAVSSKSQASEEKDSIPSQISAARELIQANEGWHEITEPLTIPGHSRFYIFLADAAADMPVYTELMSLARENKIDLLICRGRDRLGRKDALIAQVEEYLASYNVQIYSMSMPTRVQDPEEFAEQQDRASIWMRSVERAKAQDEVLEMKARHRMGMRRRIQEGLHASVLPYGYTLGPDGYGIIDEAQASIVRHIFNWLIDGTSIREIQRRLPQYATGRHPTSQWGLLYILRNPYYKGAVGYHRIEKSGHRFRDRREWLLAPGLHESIVDEECWNAAQLELDRRQTGTRFYNRYAFSGCIYCGYCEQRMIAHVSQSRGRNIEYRYYVCRQPKSICSRPTPRNSIRMEEVEDLALDWLSNRAMNPQLIASDIASMLDDRSDADDERWNEIQQIHENKRSALQRWTRDYEQGLLTRFEYYEHKYRLDNQLAELDGALNELEARRQRLDPAMIEKSLEQLVEPSIENLREHLHDRYTANRVNALLHRIGFRIEIGPDEPNLQLAPS